MYSKLVDIPTFFLGRWVFGRWVLGRWVLGVGSRGRVTPGSAGNWRWIAPRPPVSRRPGWYTPSRRRRRRQKPSRRESRAAPHPQNRRKAPMRSRFCLYINHRGAEGIFLGVGSLILGVGCLKYWALGHESDLGRWVARTRFWALGGTDQVLGVGCLRCLWRGRWVIPRGDSEVRGPAPRSPPV